MSRFTASLARCFFVTAVKNDSAAGDTGVFKVTEVIFAYDFDGLHAFSFPSKRSALFQRMFSFSASVSGSAMKRTGYTFTGWDGIGRLAAVKEDLDIHARYVPLTYRVRFFDYDGNRINTQNVSFGSSAAPSAFPKASRRRESRTESLQRIGPLWYR